MNGPIELPSSGTTVLEKFRLGGRLGEGGMAVVFEALDLRTRQRVALKMLRPELLESSELLERFQREARAISRLKGPHAVRILEVDVAENGLPFIVMELLDGHDLATELQIRGTLPVGEAVHHVIDACEAMREAHELGIVHRDLKPSNVFLAELRDERRVKVLDFGISRLLDDTGARLTKTAKTFGSPRYMSPEQVRNMKLVDHRSDIWSLGVLLYELMAGRPPFVGSSTGTAAAIVADPVPPLRGFCPEVPPDLEAAIERCLEKDPADRWSDVRELIDAVRPYATPGPLPSRALRPSIAAGLATPRGSLVKLAEGTPAASTEVSIRSKSDVPPPSPPSPHPPVRTSSDGRSFLAFMAVLALLACAVFFAARSCGTAP